MRLSSEHQLALKISIGLLLIVFCVSIIFQILNQSWIIDFSWRRGGNKYIIFIISSIIIYFVSLKLAFVTTKPIKETNQKLVDYNHNLAHELKTPLSVIKTNLELLDISYDKDLVKSSFEEISSMENIISSLLFLSENSKNKSNDKVSFIDLLEKYKKNKNIQLIINDDFVVYWDKKLFEILIKNLIENWLKYSLDNKLKIEINKLWIVFSNNIKESINKDELSKYFDIFYKWKDSNSFWSYWIWLSIVKKICDSYDLKIMLSSEKNTFKVVLSIK